MADFPQTFTTLEPSGVVGGPLTGAAELIPKGLERRWGGITHDKTDFSPFKGDDSDYDFRKDISGTVYENFPEYFMDVTSQNEADFVRSRVDNLVDYSNLSARSTGFAFAADMLVQGVVDPTNVVAVPLTGGGSIAWNAVKAGAAVALLEGGVQAARLYSDPTVSKTEAGVEVFASGLFGGAFGIGGSLSRKWGGNNPYAGIPSEAVSRIKGQLSEDVNAAETLANIASLNWENIQLLGDKPSRRLGGLTDEELSAQIGSVRSQTDEMIDPDAELGAELRRIERGPEADRFADLRNEAADLESEAILRNLEGKGYTADADLFKLADNWFTDSMLYQSVPTPMKSLLKSSIVPVSVKKFALELAGDNSIGPLAAKMGITSSGSVYTRSISQYPGRWVDVLDKTKAIHRAAFQLPDSAKLDISLRDSWANLTKSPDSYGNWMIEVNRKRVFGEEGADQFEIEALDVMDKFWKQAEQELVDSNLIGTRESLNREVAGLKLRLNEARDRMESFLEGVPVSREARGYLNPMDNNGVRQERPFLGSNDTERAASKKSWLAASASAETINRKIGSNNVKIRDLKSTDPKEPFFARYLNLEKIKTNRSGFSSDLRRYYNAEIAAGRHTIDVFDRTIAEDPSGNKVMRGWVKIDLTKTNAEGVSNLDAHIKRVVDDILTTEDPTNLDEMSFGMGRSKHFRHRKLDVPNSAIWGWIEKDPVATMRAYSDRVGPRLEFRNKFGRDVEEMTDLLNEDMVKAGMSEAEINAAMLDAKLLYDRVAGMVSANPDALNQKVAFFLKEMASFAYMGSAGFSAIPDFAKIILEHDGKNIVRGMQTYMDDTAIKIAKKDIRLAGSALEVVLSNVQRRFVDDMAYDVNADSLWGKGRSAFYVLNGLSPMTQIAKMLDGVIRSHEIIDYSLKAYAGKASKKELDFLARYGITDKHVATIARMPWQKHTGGLYLANTSEWIAPPARTSDSIPPRFDETLGMDENVAPPPGSAPEGPGPRVGPQSEASPPPKEGFTRLYRGVEKGGEEPKGMSEWLKESDEYERIRKATGRWFAEDIEEAQWYIKEGGDLFYVDVPTKDLEGFRVSGIEKTEDGLDPKKFSSRPEKEFFVTTELAGQAAPYKADAPPPDAPPPDAPEVDSYPADSEADVKEALLAFRAALHSGAVNTVIHATPADRPRIADGVAYLPMSVARKMGLKEDSRYKGYARVENGLLGLPLQFYSFSLGAVNKTMASAAHGQMKNLTVGFASMMALSYLSLKMKMPDYAWDQMSWRDSAFRSFDQAGIAALYSDLIYTGIHTSMALGGPNPTKGLISPKFNQGTDIVGGVAGIAGAGPSWADDMLRNGVGSWAQGEWGQGSKTIVRNLPFTRMWFLKNFTNEMSRAWGQ